MWKKLSMSRKVWWTLGFYFKYLTHLNKLIREDMLFIIGQSQNNSCLVFYISHNGSWTEEETQNKMCTELSDGRRQLWQPNRWMMTGMFCLQTTYCNQPCQKCLNPVCRHNKDSQAQRNAKQNAASVIAERWTETEVPPSPRPIYPTSLLLWLAIVSSGAPATTEQVITPTHPPESIISKEQNKARVPTELTPVQTQHFNPFYPP